MPPFLNFKILVPVASLAVASVVGNAQPARAVLNYYIYESGGNVVLETSGSLNLSGSFGTADTSCGPNVPAPGGSIITGSGTGSTAISAKFCTGPSSANYAGYLKTGPTNIHATAGSVSIAPASSTSGLSTVLNGGSLFFIQSSYTSGPIVSNAVFNGQTLASMGFTTTGLIGTWTLGLLGSGDKINVVVGAPPSTAVPGPLPLLGAGAAFGFSRRLRRRVSLSRSISPSAPSISA